MKTWRNYVVNISILRWKNCVEVKDDRITCNLFILENYDFTHGFRGGGGGELFMVMSGGFSYRFW